MRKGSGKKRNLYRLAKGELSISTVGMTTIDPGVKSKMMRKARVRGNEGLFNTEIWRDIVSLFTKGYTTKIPGVISEPGESGYRKYIDSIIIPGEQRGSSVENGIAYYNAIEIKYEPTRYVYDLSYNNPQILSEQESPKTATASYSYGEGGREGNLVTGESA